MPKVPQRKLLLADDSITIQKVVNLTFADEGIEVITVGDGDSAMRKITEEAPDLVLADVNMPGLNGYQVCERIRQSDAHKRTPVILLVGSFEPFDQAEAERVGADDFLTKPFQSIRQLVSKVSELLAASVRDSEAEDTSTEFTNAETAGDFSDSDEYAPAAIATAQAVGGAYADIGADDEMIQTSSASGYALDESAKFESRVAVQPEDRGETQPLSAADFREFSVDNRQEEIDDSNASFDEAADEETPGEQSDSQSEMKNEEMLAPQSAPAAEPDDDDLLEIEYDEDEEWEDEEEAEESLPGEAQTVSEPQMQTVDAQMQTQEAQIQERQPEEPEFIEEPELAFVSGDAAENVRAPEQSAISAAPEQNRTDTESPFIESPNQAIDEPKQSPTDAETNDFSARLSPEMIEAIAQRVVEKLSDRAVREIAWEVVPQMADLIIKKMAEEKLKQ